MRSTPLRPSLLLVVVAIASLLSTACGARWSDEQAEIVASRDSATAQASTGRATNSGSRASTGGEGEAGSRSATTIASGSSGGGQGAGDGDGSGSASSGGGGETTSDGGGGASGPLPCAAPSDATGVSAGEITVGSVNSLSGPAPGLAASSAAAARAYVAYRNSIGGVCGRQITLQVVDDGTDSGRYRSIIGELADTVFGVAGGFALGDVGGVEVIKASGIPIVNAPGGQEAADLPTVIDINPNPARSAKYDYIASNGGTKASLVYLAVDQSRFEANIQRGLMEDAGIQIVDVQELPLSTLNYDAAARGAVNSGANFLWFIGDQNSIVSMAQSVEDTGHEFTFFEILSFAYGSQFVQSAGPAAEGVISWLRTLPNEEAGSNEETARFNEWMERIAPSEPRDPFAADSWAASKAFFDNLEALPGPITRETFVQQLSSVETYDADGFYGPVRLGEESKDDCVVGVQVQNGRWKRLTPSSGFLCG